MLIPRPSRALALGRGSSSRHSKIHSATPYAANAGKLKGSQPALSSLDSHFQSAHYTMRGLQAAWVQAAGSVQQVAQAVPARSQKTRVNGVTTGGKAKPMEWLALPWRWVAGGAQCRGRESVCTYACNKRREHGMLVPTAGAEHNAASTPGEGEQKAFTRCVKTRRGKERRGRQGISWFLLGPAAAAAGPLREYCV